MWRPRTLLLLGLALLASITLIGILGASGARSTAPVHSSPSGCTAHYRPWNWSIKADCSVPGSNTCIDLSSIDLGKYCFNSIDLNPADWAGYIACEIALQATNIWNAIQNSVANFIVFIFQGLFQAFEAPVSIIESAISGAVASVVTAVGNFFTSFFNGVAQVTAPLGPFAPIAVVLVAGALLAGGVVAFYVIFVVVVALGKTVFNLL